jgi:hypothetical protein
MASSDAAAALAAVLRHAELPALTELRAALSAAEARAAEAAARHAEEIAAWRARATRVSPATPWIWRRMRTAGLEGALLDEYAPVDPPCRACGAEADGGWDLCTGCLAPLLARGWHAVGEDPADRADCMWGSDAPAGVLGGRTRCVDCALHLVRRRR